MRLLQEAVLQRIATLLFPIIGALVENLTSMTSETTSGVLPRTLGHGTGAGKQRHGPLLLSTSPHSAVRANVRRVASGMHLASLCKQQPSEDQPKSPATFKVLSASALSASYFPYDIKGNG